MPNTHRDLHESVDFEHYLTAMKFLSKDTALAICRPPPPARRTRRVDLDRGSDRRVRLSERNKKKRTEYTYYTRRTHARAYDVLLRGPRREEGRKRCTDKRDRPRKITRVAVCGGEDEKKNPQRKEYTYDYCVCLNARFYTTRSIIIILPTRD